MNLKKNYLFNLVYQLLIMILPLITVPYVSRVLNPEGVGAFAFTNSIVQYFILFGMLGIGIYGNKMVAMARDNKIELSKTFFSIYFFQFLMTSITLVVYITFVIFFFQENKLILLLQSLALLASVIDCSWLFVGMEKFKKIVTRNIIIKIISFLAIIIFVKNQSDLALYTIIMSLSVFLGQLIMWLYVKEYVVLVKVSFSSIVKHFRPTLIYFLPQIAMQIYFFLDKTMIGILSSNIEVGVYDYADKILKLSLAIVTSLGTVMLPRMANTFVKGDLAKAKNYINKSLEFSTLIAVPIMFGIAGLANELIPWFMTKEFTGSIFVLVILSPTILMMAWGGVFGTQYLVPLGKMKEYNISLYTGAIINLIINLILIKPYGSVGAAIGTLCSQLFVVSVQFYFVRKQIFFTEVIVKTIYYLISGIVMLIIIRLIGDSFGAKVITTFIQTLAGSITYIGVVIMFELLFKDGLILNEIKKLRSKK